MPTGRELAAGKRGRYGNGARTGVCGRCVFRGRGFGVSGEGGHRLSGLLLFSLVKPASLHFAFIPWLLVLLLGLLKKEMIAGYSVSRLAKQSQLIGLRVHTGPDRQLFLFWDLYVVMLQTKVRLALLIDHSL